MRAHQIMNRDVITVSPHTSILEATTLMLKHRISGLPVMNSQGKLLGVVSEGDFLRRKEIGTEYKRPRLLAALAGSDWIAKDFVKENGREVRDVMTRDVISVSEETPLDEIVGLMENNAINRLPVMKEGKLVGIITRTNILRAIAGLARDIPDPTADDDHIRDRITRIVNEAPWRPIGFQATIHDGVVHLHGLVSSEEAREATIVVARNCPGVKKVVDQLGLLDPFAWIFAKPSDDTQA